MGGKYESNNVVRLTPEEHRVAHLLLAKLHPNNFKIVSAAIYMFARTNKHKRVPLKVYGWLRRIHQKNMKSKKLAQVTCPKCGKIGAGGAMNRFHFDNCGKRTLSPLKGKPLSQDIIQSRIGRPGVNLGRKFTLEQRQNMGNSRLGKPQPWTSEALKLRHQKTSPPTSIKVSCIGCKNMFNILTLPRHKCLVGRPWFIS